MCIAIVSPKNTPIPTDNILRTCFRNNPDGAGFAFNFDNKVHILKGFMDVESFIKTIREYDSRYDLKSRGVLIHMRIGTSGKVSNGGFCDQTCTHPFPISNRNKHLKKLKCFSDYAVIHNGIIELTNDKNSELSDTMSFIKLYISKLASNPGWFQNKQNIELIYQLANSKIAILDNSGDWVSTPGFHQADDGCYYSNRSYESNYGYYGCGYGYFDDWYNDYYSSESQYELPLMQLKPNEAVVYEDGEVEDYRFDYHDTFRTFVSSDGEVYIALDDEFEDEISFSHLSYVGNGTIVDNFFPTCADGLRPIPFRKDAVAVL